MIRRWINRDESPWLAALLSVVLGGSGGDLLRGHLGNDDLRGGRGFDACVGGPGRNQRGSC